MNNLETKTKRREIVIAGEQRWRQGLQHQIVELCQDTLHDFRIGISWFNHFPRGKLKQIWAHAKTIVNWPDSNAFCIGGKYDAICKDRLTSLNNQEVNLAELSVVRKRKQRQSYADWRWNDEIGLEMEADCKNIAFWLTGAWCSRSFEIELECSSLCSDDEVRITARMQLHGTEEG